jgi:DNA-binding MarR family transcriptional regulator
MTTEELAVLKYLKSQPGYVIVDWISKSTNIPRPKIDAILDGLLKKEHVRQYGNDAYKITSTTRNALKGT